MLVCRSQLLDVGVAAQTPGAQRAMMELLNFNEASNLVYPLRYLLAAAYTTHPGDYLIKDLLVSDFFKTVEGKWAVLLYL